GRARASVPPVGSSSACQNPRELGPEHSVAEEDMRALIFIAAVSFSSGAVADTDSGMFYSRPDGSLYEPAIFDNAHDKCMGSDPMDNSKSFMQCMAGFNLYPYYDTPGVGIFDGRTNKKLTRIGRRYGCQTTLLWGGLSNRTSCTTWTDSRMTK